MVFPYRNDVRKVLIPYLETLPEEQWFQTHPHYTNNIAWIVKHITESEDHWVHTIGLKQSSVLPEDVKTPKQLLDIYQEVRANTDKTLFSLTEQELEQLVDVPTFSDGWKPPSLPTLRWLFHHVYTHEAYHVGQISVIARLIGIKPPHY